MSNDNETLARRWLASKHWGGWRVGMVQMGGDVVVQAHGPGSARPYTPVDKGWWFGYLGGQSSKDCGLLPDLDHPGTRAFLLEDVRRAWGADGNFASYCEFGATYWSLDPAAGDDWNRSDTEAAALIAALEACDG